MNGSPEPGEFYAGNQRDVIVTCDSEANPTAMQPLSGRHLTNSLKPDHTLSSLNTAAVRPHHTFSIHASIKSESASMDENITTSCSSSYGCTSGDSSSSFNSAQHTTLVAHQQTFPAPKDLSSKNTNIPHKDSVTSSILSSSAQARTDHQKSSSLITTMTQVKAKYMTELEYMLREFKKLERQLLGAKSGVNGVEESSGSKERREKLHSFIIHLEDTIRQIEVGCKQENDRNQSNGVRGDNEIGDEFKLQPVKLEQDGHILTITEGKMVSSELGPLPIEERKHEEEVRKLDDHIRTNLLPVKVRLSKQLAAQLGANQNPVGMPVIRRGIQPPDNIVEKGTFAAAAEKKRLAQMKLHPTAETTVSSSTMHADDATTTNHCPPVAHSQFGKPLGSGGSSLTHKLHGETLGSENRPYGYGVGTKIVSKESGAAMDFQDTTTRKTMVAGVAPGSDQSQIMSSLSSVNSAHRNFFDNPQLDTIAPCGNIVSSTIPPINIPAPFSPPLTHNKSYKIDHPFHVANPLNHPLISKGSDEICDQMSVENTAINLRDNDAEKKIVAPIPTKDMCENHSHVPIVSMTIAPRSPKKSLSDPTLTLEERAEIIRRRLQKKKRRLMSEQQPRYEIEELPSYHFGQKNDLSEATDPLSQLPLHLKKSSKVTSVLSREKNSNRCGPKAVEYICALCNETYTSTCDSNPWWTLNTQECPKCLKIQIPRIDIASPANEIEYHPALLVQAAEDNNVSLAVATEKMGFSLSNTIIHPIVNMKVSNSETSGGKLQSAILSGDEIKEDDMDQDSASDLDFGPINGDDLSTSDSDSSSEFGENMSLAARAEHEEFGKEYSGPKFMDHDSSRLLILMSHASTCPGLHKNPRARNVCRNIKLLMLHVRDCPGTTSCSDICPFPWCRKTKHLLYHLVSCTGQSTCCICSRTDHSVNLDALKALNDFRMKKRMVRSSFSSHGDFSHQTKGIVASNQSIYQPPSSAQKKIIFENSQHRSKPSVH